MILGDGAGSAGRLESVHAAVVYNNKTGKVVHTHHFLIFEGAVVRPKPEELTQMALEHAEAAGVKREGVDALYAGKQRLDPGKIYRVDIESRTLIAEQVPPKRLVNRATAHQEKTHELD